MGGDDRGGVKLGVDSQRNIRFEEHLISLQRKSTKAAPKTAGNDAPVRNQHGNVVKMCPCSPVTSSTFPRIWHIERYNPSVRLRLPPCTPLPDKPSSPKAVKDAHDETVDPRRPRYPQARAHARHNMIHTKIHLLHKLPALQQLHHVTMTTIRTRALVSTDPLQWHARFHHVCCRALLALETLRQGETRCVKVLQELLLLGLRPGLQEPTPAVLVAQVLHCHRRISRIRSMDSQHPNTYTGLVPMLEFNFPVIADHTKEHAP
jgi:hypothetical protein